MKTPRRRIQKARRKAEKRTASQIAFLVMARREEPTCEMAFCSDFAHYRFGDMLLCEFHAGR